jgi:hypothetical protein
MDGALEDARPHNLHLSEVYDGAHFAAVIFFHPKKWEIYGEFFLGCKLD